MLLILPARDANQLLRDILWRQDKIDASTGDCALRHVWLASCIQFLRDGNASYLLNATQRRSVITVIARDDYGNKLSIPVPGQGPQENRDDVWTATRL